MEMRLWLTLSWSNVKYQKPGVCHRLFREKMPMNDAGGQVVEKCLPTGAP